MNWVTRNTPERKRNGACKKSEKADVYVHVTYTHTHKLQLVPSNPKRSKKKRKLLPMLKLEAISDTLNKQK